MELSPISVDFSVVDIVSIDNDSFWEVPEHIIHVYQLFNIRMWFYLLYIQKLCLQYAYAQYRRNISISSELHLHMVTMDTYIHVVYA